MGSGRNGRGSRNVLPVISERLLPRQQLLIGASSGSCVANLKGAQKLFPPYACQHGAPDPVHVTKDSSVPVLNILYEYWKIGTDPVLKNDTMGGMVPGLEGITKAPKLHGSLNVVGNPVTLFFDDI